MTSCQSFVGVIQSRVPCVDPLQVREIILVGGLHIFQEVLESLKFINFSFDAIVLLGQRLELLVSLLYLSVFFFDFLCKYAQVRDVTIWLDMNLQFSRSKQLPNP